MKLSDRAKQIITAVAPVLGATLGGPLGGLAGNVLAQSLGVDTSVPKALEDSILSQSPEVIGNIRLAEIELQKQAAANDLDLERINAADRVNARDREVKTGDSWTPRALAGLVVVGWLVVQWFLITHIVDGQMRELVARVLGTLDSALMLVLSYYFGSSVSSHRKDEALSAIAKQA